MHIYSLPVETAEPRTGHEIIITYCSCIFLDIYLMPGEKKRAAVERASSRELLSIMSFTGGGGHQDGTEH